MQKKFFILPGLSLLFGAAGFFIRSAELRTAIEPVTGLVIPGKSATSALIALSAVFAALCIILLLRAGKNITAPDSFAAAFPCSGPAGVVFFAMFCASAALMLAGGIVLFLSSPPALGLIFAALAVIAAVCVFMRALYLLRSGGNTRPFNAVIVVYFCMFLVSVYRGYTAEPNLLIFAYKILALVFSLLAAYYCAGFDFGRRDARKALFCCAMAVYFCFVVFADNFALHLKLLMSAAFLFSLADLTLLRSGCGRGQA